MGYQQIIIMGNLTRDVEVRTVGQSQVAKTGVAVSEKFRKQDGTTGENTEFFDIEIWDKASVYPYLKKGQQVLVVGLQRTDKWQDQNGQSRETKKVRVTAIQLCGSRPAQPQAQAPAPGYTPQPQYQQPAPPPQYAPQPQYQAPAPPPQPTYQPAPVPPAPQYQQPAPPPVNDPAYTQQVPSDLPF